MVKNKEAKERVRDSVHQARSPQMRRALIVVVPLLAMSLLVVPVSEGQSVKPAPVSPKPDAQYNPPDGALEAAATMLTIPYAPMKATVALAGAIIVGLDYLFTLGQGAGSSFIWRVCTGGDYAVTQDHLTGKKPLRFLGFPDPPSG